MHACVHVHIHVHYMLSHSTVLSQHMWCNRIKVYTCTNAHMHAGVHVHVHVHVTIHVTGACHYSNNPFHLVMLFPWYLLCTCALPSQCLARHLSTWIANCPICSSREISLYRKAYFGGTLAFACANTRGKKGVYLVMWCLNIWNITDLGGTGCRKLISLQITHES